MTNKKHKLLKVLSKKEYDVADVPSKEEIQQVLLKYNDDFIQVKCNKKIKDTSSVLPKISQDEFQCGLRLDNQSKEDESGICVVCNGIVISVITKGYHGDSKHMVYGPAGRNQITIKHQGYHCKNCGLCYKFLPTDL